MSDAAELLGELVRHEREVRGISLREAAAECGVGMNVLFRVEHHTPPSFDNFLIIARWLKLNLGDLPGTP